MCSLAYVAVVPGLLVTGSLHVEGILATASTSSSHSAGLSDMRSLPSAIALFQPSPQLEQPEWLTSQDAAAAAASQVAAVAGIVTYSVTTRGTVTPDLTEFRQQANATLNDSRGWARLGVSFQEINSGGSFTLVLSEASEMSSFSSGCSSDYSCNAGRYVIINQDRWLGATSSWNDAGGSLRDYRHMVINHETGHWLGHQHEFCGGPGQAAPVMQQQSIDLQGCNFNPWPLASEVWSTQPGIGNV